MDIQNSLYADLDYENGSLYSTTAFSLAEHGQSDWIDKGEWLAAAQRAGAEKVFFIENNPIIVFANSSDELFEKAKVFNQIWCLARPRLLFLYSPGGLDVYDLARKPINLHREKEWREIENLALLKKINQVSDELLKFHRENIESGKIFGEERFGSLDNRADKSLIRDLKIVRRQLIDAGLDGKNVRFAHALIGRSIFIRYLEDRSILTKEYFFNIAHQKAGWTELLKNPPNKIDIRFTENELYYPRILSEKKFTYKLFKKLAQDFNGDMFPNIEEEEKIIKQEHLDIIQDLLYGDVGAQRNLFFFSYKFNIIPLDLISAIYEEFYHDSTDIQVNRKDGAYYTPPVLVEFMLSRILTLDELKKTPCILDPACGSGIFLVEAFRRIVRYKWYTKKSALTFDELKDILKDQIRGIEVNTEAARITAFSLYLSLLHYLDPPAINEQIKKGNKLPNLIAINRKSENYFHCILPSNTFDVPFIESNVLWKEKFGNKTIDIIIGNPPWGAPGKKADLETKNRQKILINWCKQHRKPIGDNEPSQAFLWRALDFLKESGKAGLLVSAGVLFKHNTTSQEFRKQWFENVVLSEVFNFCHVRKFFFKGADSPFITLFFQKGQNKQKAIAYWSAKQTIILKNIQAIILSKYDIQIIRDQELTTATTWKINWWGRDGDRRFIQSLSMYKPLISFIDRKNSGQGLKFNPPTDSAEKIVNYKFCPIDLLSNRYDELDKSLFTDIPKKVHRLGIPTVYTGQRLLIKRGIDEHADNKGRIIARYENIPFCFTNAIHGIKLNSPHEWKYQLVLGILWSSLARYYLFMTSSNWGLWHHEIHLEDELLQLPITLDEQKTTQNDKVIQIVDKLRNYHPKAWSLIEDEGVPEDIIKTTRKQYETELDEAIFDLYDLTIEQRDLIRDFCEITLPFFYQPFNSDGVMPAIKDKDIAWIKEYVYIFCRCWNAYLADDEEMRAQIHVGAHENIVALEFYPVDKGDTWDLVPKRDSWQSILDQLNTTLRHPLNSSQIIIDNLVQTISSDCILLIKRNEKRFWTRSLAREDAHSTICKRMLDTKPDDPPKSMVDYIEL